jgi:hypothetical protein
VRDEEQEVLGRAEAGPGGVAPPAPLADAERCFQAGDFLRARQLAADALRSESADLRAAAQDLLDRTKADPAATWMALGCLLIFAAVVWLTLLR